MYIERLNLKLMMHDADISVSTHLHCALLHKATTALRLVNFAKAQLSRFIIINWLHAIVYSYSEKL